MMRSLKKMTQFRILAVLAIILGCLTFTPLVMPYGKFQPTLFHLPYTLWTGLIVALLFVFLTYLAVKTYLDKAEDES